MGSTGPGIQFHGCIRDEAGRAVARKCDRPQHNVVAARGSTCGMSWPRINEAAVAEATQSALV